MSDMAQLALLLRLARDTVASPREGAGTVLAARPPMQALYLMFALVVVISLFLGEIVALLADLPMNGPLTGPMQSSLFWMAIVQGGFLFLIANAMHRIGRFFGGTGAFEEAFLLTIWLQFIFNLLQIVQIVALLIIPPVAGLVSILAIALFFWLLVNFVATLHGFTSLGGIFLVTLISGFMILTLLSMILSLLGITTDPTGSLS